VGGSHLVVLLGGGALIIEWKHLRRESTLLNAERAKIEQQRQELPGKSPINKRERNS